LFFLLLLAPSYKVFSFFLILLVNEEETCDFSKFMVIPSFEEERQCYEKFYDATSNKALLLRVCPICAWERFPNKGDQTWLLSDPSIVEVLNVRMAGHNGEERLILRHLLDVEEGSVSCWMCHDCIKALEQHSIPKLSLANNLWVGNVPHELSTMTIPEQLLIAQYYARCYIFKLFSWDYDVHLPPDQLYTVMAGNASLFKMNTQEVVEMLNGQQMPSPVAMLASVIAITFVGTRKLLTDWLTKKFRVRRAIVHQALIWLKINNPIYEDIQIDAHRLTELPEDDVPEEFLTMICREEDNKIVEEEQESYLVVETDDQCGKGIDDVDMKIKMVRDDFWFVNWHALNISWWVF
jgi:hypothetical protein